MTSLRHLALGCCVISALAGMLRLFWPENSFKTVINAVLVLYILTAGVQMVRGIDWYGLADELRNLPAGGSTVGYEAYRRELALTASVDAVRVSTRRSVCRMASASSRRWISATKRPSSLFWPSTRARCLGSLRGMPHDRPGETGPAGRQAARSPG